MANDNGDEMRDKESTPVQIGANRLPPSLILLTLVPILAFLGIVIWAYGDAPRFFQHPARVGMVVATVLLTILALFSGSSGLSSGEREDRDNRWIFLPITLLSLLLTWLPPYLTPCATFTRSPERRSPTVDVSD